MSEVKSHIPFDTTNPAYRPSWQESQEDQDAYDDRMRRKVNPQTGSYVQNNELICFGIAEHTLEETMPTWTPQAESHMNILRSWFPRRKMEEVSRPVYKSDQNWTNYATRAQVRCLLGLLVIRELPFKNFYCRVGLAWAWCTFFIARGLGRGLINTRPIVLYNQDIHMKALGNYPDLFYWNLTRVLPKNPPIPDAHREWQTRQNPVFHAYHKTCYRYRMRRARYVPWDGSMNQPVMPYLHDNGTNVINGTFKRQTNSVPQLK